MTKTEKMLYVLVATLLALILFMALAINSHDCPLPTAIELQTRLVEAGYNVQVDGKLGRETTKALEEYHDR